MTCTGTAAGELGSRQSRLGPRCRCRRQDNAPPPANAADAPGQSTWPPLPVSPRLPCAVRGSCLVLRRRDEEQACPAPNKEHGIGCCICASRRTSTHVRRPISASITLLSDNR